MPPGKSDGSQGGDFVPQAISGQHQQLIPILNRVLVKLGGADEGPPKGELTF